MTSVEVCAFADCTTHVKARGWCNLHYGRWRRNGDPAIRSTSGQRRDRPRRPVMVRFAEKIEQADECWRWTASLDAHGYGQLWDGKKLRKAYRIAYELHIGDIPEGLTLDHLCRNRWCVNPWHLEPVPMRVNHARGVAARTHCKHGHRFTRENTYRTASGRHCRTCRAAAARRFRERHREAA